MPASFCFITGALAVLALVWSWHQRRTFRRQVDLLEAALAGRTDPAANADLSPDLARLFAQCMEERERLRNTALETEEHLSAILASMEEGVMVVDNGHVIRLANPSLARMFVLKGPPVGQTVLGAFRLPMLETLLADAVENLVSRQEEVVATIQPGKPSAHLIISAVPLKGGDGVLGGIAVVRDVSRLRKLEEMRREFVANVSHELRTPLSIFQGHLELLLDQEEYPPEQVRETMRIMRKHSQRLNALVEDLLTLTRLESRRDPLKREPLQLDDFLRDALAEWQPKVAGKQIVLSGEVAPETAPLLADSFRLRQVLDNLLDNALKYTPPGGTIQVRARPDESRTQLRVEDSGAGIPPADLPHIFERFYRADKARSRELGGTGLGLSIVKHIVQAHGGTVAAESTYGKGTAIVLSFPGE
jgi:two-component system phosphate regulon sensor histidine kinase PhoR